MRLLLSGPGPIELSAGATLIQLIGDPRVSDHLKRQDRIHLWLDGISARRTPGIDHHVYLRAMDATGGTRQAGALRFHRDPRTRSFDVTSLLRDLERVAPVGDKVVVSLVPDGAPDPHAAPRIGGLYLVAA